MSHDELTYRIAFASVRGMGIDLATKLLEVVGSERAFFEMNERELRALTGGRSRIYSEFYRRQQLERAKAEVEFIAGHNIGAHYYTSPTFPTRLREADDAPIMLYSSGHCDLNAAHMVSIVGTRHATPYGVNFCMRLLQDLSAALPQGLVVVSGLAYGIDIAAHRAALRCHVPTVAVLPRGLNRIYPAQHRTDAVNIVRDGGAIVTDYLSTDEVHKGNFLARNRIIAALSDCTVVVESAASGGALVTASLAASYNREVLALPGRVSDEFSTGCNRLLRTNRAAVITSADDLLRTMNWDIKAQQPKQLQVFPTLTPEEQAVVDALRAGGDMHINDIASALQQPVYRVMSTLVELDCKGIVSAMPGSRYAMAIR